MGYFYKENSRIYIHLEETDVTADVKSEGKYNKLVTEIGKNS